MNAVFAVVALLLLIVVPSTVVASSSWTVSTGSTSCSGAFTVSNVAFSCDNNGQECGFGSNVKVTGYLMAKTTLPESARITAQGCVYSLFCKTVLDESGVDLCDGNVLSPQNGQSCPSAGLYRISTSFDLPNNSNAASLLSGKTVTVKATIAGDNSSSSATSCSFQAIASNGSSSSASYQMSWGSMAAASLVFVALGGAYGVRRSRRSIMAQIDLDAAEDQLPSSDFELMKSSSSSPPPHGFMA